MESKFTEVENHKAQLVHCCLKKTVTRLSKVSSPNEIKINVWQYFLIFRRKKKDSRVNIKMDIKVI